MRRARLRSLPALSHWFHVMPWDLERMTFDEIDEYVKQLPKKGG